MHLGVWLGKHSEHEGGAGTGAKGLKGERESLADGARSKGIKAPGQQR